MQIINSEIKIPTTGTPNSEYFETALKNKKIDFVRWAIVAIEKDHYILNVSHKITY